MNELDALQASSLPIDWAVMQAGWNRFLTTEQLQDYALAQIGYGPDSEFEGASTLAFADDRDDWTISRCLEQLASDTPEARRRAARVWQWAALSMLIKDLEKGLAAGIEAGNTAENDYWLESSVYDVWSDLREFWERPKFESIRFPAAQNWEWPREIDTEWAKEVLTEHRRFLAQEEAELRQEA